MCDVNVIICWYCKWIGYERGDKVFIAGRTIYLTSGIGKRFDTGGGSLLELQDANSIVVRVSNMLTRLAGRLLACIIVC